MFDEVMQRFGLDGELVHIIASPTNYLYVVATGVVPSTAQAAICNNPNKANNTK